MSDMYSSEPKELLLPVVPDPHFDKTVKALVTLTGWPAQVVKEIEAVEKRPLAQIVRDLVIDGIRARNVQRQTPGKEVDAPGSQG